MPKRVSTASVRIKSLCIVFLQRRSPSSSSSFMSRRRSLPELDRRLTGMFPLRLLSGARLDKSGGRSIERLPEQARRAGMPRTIDEGRHHMIRVAFVLGDYPAEQRRLREEAALSYSSAEVEVGILSVSARPFDGLTPAEIQAAAPIFHAAFRQAEREGYDAGVPLGMIALRVAGGGT